MNKIKTYHLLILCFCIIWFIILCKILVNKFYIKSDNYNKTFCAYVDSSLMDLIQNESFYINLISNVKSPESHRNNTVADFNTKLAEKITLRDEWEVGLSEISYTKSWFNIKSRQDIKIFGMDNSSLQGKDSYISPGYYSDIKTLINEINKALKSLELNAFKNIIYRTPILRYDEVTNRVFVLPGRSPSNSKFYYPLLTDELEYMLGFRNINSNDTYMNHFIDPETNNYYLAQSDIRLEKHINYDVAYNMSVNSEKSLLVELKNPSAVQFNVHEMHILVYCSIVHPILVGDTYAKLLRQVEIPKSTKFGEQCVLRYPEPFYIPLVTNEFENIEINIKDDTDELIPFDFGRSSVTLHFKKKATDEFKSIRRILH